MYCLVEFATIFVILSFFSCIYYGDVLILGIMLVFTTCLL